MHNVTSPHTEYGLDAGTEYTVYLQSHGPDGDSLMSTAQVFLTRPIVQHYCPHGEPLFHPNGYRSIIVIIIIYKNNKSSSPWLQFNLTLNLLLKINF